MKDKNTQAGFHLFKTKPRTIELSPCFYWEFYAKNGRSVARSGNYNSKQGAVIGIKSVLNILSATDMNQYYDHTGKTVDLFVIK